MAGMLPAVAIAVAVVVRRPLTLIRWRLIATCFVALVVGLTPFATQPIRAAYFPAMNEGEPTGCRTKIAASCTLSKGTYDAFMYNLNRRQYGKPSLSDRQASLGEQVGMWWLYFRWQWLRDADNDHPFAQSLLAATFLVLGLLGAWVHFNKDRRYVLVFRNAHVHDDAAAHLLPELQARRVAGSNVAGAARSARPRLLLPVELLGVGRVGGAGPGVRLGSVGDVARPNG